MFTVALVGTRYPDLSIEREILEGVSIVVGSGDTPHDIVEVTDGVDVVIAGSRPKFTASVLERMTSRAIVRSGIGVDSVDLDHARRLGFWVVNVPDYGTEAVAFHTLSLILGAMRRLPQSDRLVKLGKWGFSELRPMHLPSALTAGVVGHGRIGRRVTEQLQAVGFGAVIGHDPYVTGMDTELGDLLEMSDIVTLHAPGPSDGSPLLGPSEIGRMKPGSILVNTARGSLIDAPALAAGMAEGRPRIAALDVFTPEPPNLSVFAAVKDQLILSPHTAWYTEETETELRVKSAWEARRILEGTEPLHPIVRPEEAS